MTADDVGFGYGRGGLLFRHATFVLEPGMTYALTGPSGAGKSTMLSLLNRSVQPREGSLSFDGVRRVNWVFQNPYGLARRLVLDHVATPRLDAGETMPQATRRARELVTRFGLAAFAEQEFRTLSGGQAQRLMLARAIACDPDLLLVDEPTAQLDRRTAAEVNAVMAELADDGRIVVVATHDERTRDSCARSFSMADWMPTESTSS